MYFSINVLHYEDSPPSAPLGDDFQDDPPSSPLTSKEDLERIVESLNENLRDKTPEEIAEIQQAIVDSLQSKKQMIQLRQR